MVRSVNIFTVSVHLYKLYYNEMLLIQYCSQLTSRSVNRYTTCALTHAHTYVLHTHAHVHKHK